LALVGFSSTVDVVTPLTTNHDSLKSIVSGIYADGITAFYDAVDRAIDIASSGGGIRVVVALTDGNDNNSSQSLNAVITKAKQLRIPIYVVGLGGVDKNPLKRLAQQTNGQYFYARNAKELTKVYDVIRQRLQSYYTISYETQNYDPNIVGRSVSLMYEGDSVAVSPARATFSLPPNVVEYLKTRRRNLLMLSGGLVVILIGTSVVIYRRRKKRQNVETISV
jgi:Ca-activated chloride channel family protein